MKLTKSGSFHICDVVVDQDHVLGTRGQIRTMFRDRIERGQNVCGFSPIANVGTTPRIRPFAYVRPRKIVASYDDGARTAGDVWKRHLENVSHQVHLLGERYDAKIQTVSMRCSDEHAELCVCVCTRARAIENV